ncbi:hypothetical protein D3C84_1012160 [compost metagenome]
MLMVPEEGAKPGTSVPRMSATLRPAADCCAMSFCDISCTVPGIEAMLASLRVAETTVSDNASGPLPSSIGAGAGCRMTLLSPLKRHCRPLSRSTALSACSAL